MERLLGAHNAHTGAEPRGVWSRLLNFTARCQRLDVMELLDWGVRYFDFRVRCDGRTGEVYFCHGLVWYRGSVTEVLSRMDSYLLCRGEAGYVRIVYDDTFGHGYRPLPAVFVRFLDVLRHVHVVEVVRKSDWRAVLPVQEVNVGVMDCFRNYRGYRWIPCPDLWTRRHRDKIQGYIDAHRGYLNRDTVFLCDRAELFRV